VAKKGAICPIFEGDMPPKKMCPQYWRQYWCHNRNPVKEVLKLPIGIPRTMSLSTMISALHMHRDWLHFDQGIEICLMGCLLNTGARFHHIFSLMSEAKLNENENEKHHCHPFLYYLEESMRTFGTW
jgi:hypothetical protein